MSSDDRYRNFAHLTALETAGEDFEIEIEESGRDPRILVMAPHGGGIEPHTDDLAREIAGDEFTFYAFRGIKSRDNYTLLHVKSTNFDEDDAVRLAERAEVVLAVHGKSGDGEFVMVGGRHSALVDEAATMLEELEIETRDPPRKVAARKEENICNQCRQGGVQLELSMEIRERLRSDSELRGRFVLRLRHLLHEAVNEPG